MLTAFVLLLTLSASAMRGTHRLSVEHAKATTCAKTVVAPGEDSEEEQRR